MNKIILSCLFVFFVWPVVHAEPTPSEPHISVNGYHKISAVPDILRLSLSLIETGRDVEEVSQSVSKRTTRLIKELKNLGIDKKDLTSSHLRIVPHYNWQNREQVYVTTEVARDIEVILRDLSQYDEFIRTLLKAKAGRINSTVLESSKEDSLRKKALQAAMANARNKAELLVSDLNVKVGSVYAITHQSHGPVNLNARVLYSAAKQAESSFEPGLIEMSESVSVVYYLSNRQ